VQRCRPVYVAVARRRCAVAATIMRQCNATEPHNANRSQSEQVKGERNNDSDDDNDHEYHQNAVSSTSVIASPRPAM
jgi:hypothetical protein